VEYKRPAGAYPLRGKICRISTSFQGALDFKISLDFLKGLWSYEGFNLRGSGYPKFSAPSSGETMRQTPKSFRAARTCSRSSITVPSLVGLGFHPPPGQPKTLSFLFVCFSVRHAFERQRLCARFRHEGVNDFDALVCSCAPVFNFIRFPAIGDTTKCRSPKNGKIWVLSLPEGDRINRSRRNLARSVHYGSALAHAALNLNLIGKRGSVHAGAPQMSKFVQNCGLGSRKPTQRTHSHEISYVSVHLGSPPAHKI